MQGRRHVGRRCFGPLPLANRSTDILHDGTRAAPGISRGGTRCASRGSMRRSRRLYARLGPDVPAVLGSVSHRCGRYEATLRNYYDLTAPAPSVERMIATNTVVERDVADDDQIVPQRVEAVPDLMIVEPTSPTAASTEPAVVSPRQGDLHVCGACGKQYLKTKSHQGKRCWVCRKKRSAAHQ